MDIPQVDHSFYKKHHPFEQNPVHSHFYTDLVKGLISDPLENNIISYGVSQTYPNSISKDRSIGGVTGDYWT